MNTEEKIIEAAREVFARKGMYGARMQEIADLAGINKSLLHYYFRNKEQLFLAVFQKEVSHFFNSIIPLIDGQRSQEEKLEKIIDQYSKLFLKNPYLPQMVFMELQQKPERVIEMILPVVSQIRDKFNEEYNEKNKTSSMENVSNASLPGNLELLIDAFSLCIMPFLGAPLIEKVFFNGNRKALMGFLKNRPEHIKKLLMTYLKNH